MVAAMEHMTEAEKAAYHGKIYEAMVKDWEEMDEDPEIPTELDKEDRKKVERLSRKVRAEEENKCLNERS
jgi:hypothetical protein